MKLPDRYGKVTNTRPTGKYPQRPVYGEYLKSAWVKRDEEVLKLLSTLPLSERIRIRMTPRSWWPAKWRSSRIPAFHRAIRHLYHLRGRRILLNQLEDALARFDEACKLWPDAVRHLTPRAVRVVISEMEGALEQLEKVPLLPTTKMSVERAQVAKHLHTAAMNLTLIMRPHVRIADDTLHEPEDKVEEKLPVPLPEFGAIDMDKLANLEVSDNLFNAIWRLKEAVPSWMGIRPMIEPPSVRNQIDYLISQIVSACYNLQEDPSIASSREAQDKLQEMIGMTLSEIDRVMQGVERVKVDGFLGDLSALRSQIRR